MSIELENINVASSDNGGNTPSSSLPIIVTDSGSSLPSASGYQVGDTFLNTSDKKIYKATADSYELNTNVTNTATIDYTTGIVNDFQINTKYIYKTLFSPVWVGNESYFVTFSCSNLSSTNAIMYLVNSDSGTYSWSKVLITIESKKIYYRFFEGISSSASKNIQTLLLDYELQIDTKYTLRLEKTSNILKATLLDATGVEILNNSIETENATNTSGSTSIYYGYVYTGGSYGVYQYTINGDIYLLESGNNFLKPSSALSWDSGTDLTDKTEYADKTNGALYLYENSELVKIGSSAPTVLTDQTATSMALAGNTIYKWTSALTSLSFASVEVSNLETVLYFTTGGTITFTDSSSLKWGGDGSAPSLEANTIYCISIRNGLAEIDTFGTVS